MLTRLSLWFSRAGQPPLATITSIVYKINLNYVVTSFTTKLKKFHKLTAVKIQFQKLGLLKQYSVQSSRIQVTYLLTICTMKGISAVLAHSEHDSHDTFAETHREQSDETLGVIIPEAKTKWLLRKKRVGSFVFSVGFCIYPIIDENWR